VTGGRPVGIFTKHGSGVDPDFFAVEAAGLRWLAAAGPEAARVVRVLEVGGNHLVLEHLHAVPATREAAEDFGRALVHTHRAGAPAFGSPPAGHDGDGYIGKQAMTLRPEASWGTFYAAQRLLPYASAARDRDRLSARGMALVERVCERLTAGELDDGDEPSRLHGDLWAGNIVHTAAGVVMIDPAAHGGHRLTDLAMLALFGTPHLDAVLGAYAEEAGLPPGWRELLGLHQLHPLLVHAASHGAAYGAEAEQVAQRYAG